MCALTVYIPQIYYPLLKVMEINLNMGYDQ